MTRFARVGIARYLSLSVICFSGMGPGKAYSQTEQVLNVPEQAATLRTYRARLAALKSSLSTIDARATIDEVTSFAFGEQPPNRVFRFSNIASCCIKGDKRRLTYSTRLVEARKASGSVVPGDSGPAAEIVFLHTGDSANLASRNPDGNGYRLTSRHGGDHEEALGLQAELGTYFQPQWHCDTYDLSRAMETTTFVIRRVARLTLGGRPAIRFDFEDRSIKKARVNGWWIVRPEGDWPVVSYHITRKEDVPNFGIVRTISARVEYGVGDRGGLIPKELTYENQHEMTARGQAVSAVKERTGQSGPSYQTKAKHIRYQSYALNACDDAVFTLASIGLGHAEYKGSPPQVPAHIVFMLLSIATFTAGVCIKAARFWHNRKKGRAGP